MFVLSSEGDHIKPFSLALGTFQLMRLLLMSLLSSYDIFKIGPSVSHVNRLRGCIFSHVRPSYERAVSDLDRPMNISLWA
jgi:hypothetical protein